VFKSRWFSRAARRVGIGGDELCAAVNMLVTGRADDLGGGVWKKRLGGNRQRAVVLGRGGRCWVYEFLFDKQNRPDIAADELRSFRRLAKVYAGLSDDEIDRYVQAQEWEEICHG
jgi:hypothetical protein